MQFVDVNRKLEMSSHEYCFQGFTIDGDEVVAEEYRVAAVSYEVAKLYMALVPELDGFLYIPQER